MLPAQLCRKSQNPSLSIDCEFFFLIRSQKEHCGEGCLRAGLHRAAFLFTSLGEQFGFGDTETAYEMGLSVLDKSSGCTAQAAETRLVPSECRAEDAPGEPVGDGGRTTGLGPFARPVEAPKVAAHEL